LLTLVVIAVEFEHAKVKNKNIVKSIFFI